MDKIKNNSDSLEDAIYDKILNLKEILKLDNKLDELHKKNKKMDARISELSTQDQVKCNIAGIQRNFDDISSLDSICGELEDSISSSHTELSKKIDILHNMLDKQQDQIYNIKANYKKY